MRISDWSSDVCSSDLAGGSAAFPAVGACNVYTPSMFGSDDPSDFDCSSDSPSRYYCPTGRMVATRGVNGPPDYLGIYVHIVRKIVVSGTSVLFRVDLGGRRIFKIKTYNILIYR